MRTVEYRRIKEKIGKNEWPNQKKAIKDKIMEPDYTPDDASW